MRALFRAQEAMIEAERRRADDECSARLHVESELAASKESVERLELLVKEYERARFGKRSEKFNPDQMQLVLEDIEIAIAEVQERQDDRARRAGTAPSSRRTRRAARAFPAHLPRIEQVIEPENLECPCGCGRMVQIGEDRSRRLDVMAAQYRVIETVRPRYACAKGCAGVAQAPAPAHLVEGGIPTEALLAQVAVAKFSEHMPLYRQSQVLARHGIFIDRAVLADWMGTVAFHLAPLVERMSVVMKQSGRLFIDETRAGRLCSIRAGAERRPAICGLSCATIAATAALIHQSWSTTTRQDAVVTMLSASSRASTASFRSTDTRAIIGSHGPSAKAACRCGWPHAE
ncbi:transposase [Bradyrhizobium japonicum]|nr:transposase [Bradyrhizobium japonicum]